MQCYYELGKNDKAVEMIMPLLVHNKRINISDRYRSIIELAKSQTKDL